MGRGCGTHDLGLATEEPIASGTSVLGVPTARPASSVPAMQDLEGKVAVVTGGASGIGLGLARRFAGERMRVVLADVEPAALDKATAELADEFGADNVVGVLTDVRRRRCGGRPGRGRVRAVRRRPRAVQQRRCRRRRARLDGAPRPLALGRRGEPPGGRPRHSGVRAPDDRAGRRTCRQHGVGRRHPHRPGDGALLRHQACGGGAVGVAVLRPPAHRRRRRGIRPVPGVGAYQHRRHRAQPALGRGARRAGRRCPASTSTPTWCGR